MKKSCLHEPSAIYTVLNAMIKQAVNDELIGKNVVAKVKKPKLVKTHETVTLSADEVKKFLSVIKNEKHHAFFKLAFASGLRRSELLGLAWSNVDFKKQTITVEQTVIRAGNDIILSKSTKNASSKRSIKIDTETMAELKKHSITIKERMLSTYEWINNDLVFPGEKGNPTYPTYASALCKKYATAIGKPAFSMHGTRHTHATLLIEAGVNFKVIQTRLGHASFNETMDTYSHLTPILEYDAVDKLEKILS
ncbi:tyrosine-type recombinase/integrase [Megasphaera cerevisiae]|uniref:tyrosine-type recombinase/integrase n=2 Tax=Megasphaera cerevisiae TaxID=39029 RepID=UPI001F3A5B5C|nr:site-specific integrase [Megasphaera cerevisiae]